MSQDELRLNISMIREQMRAAYKTGNVNHVKKLADWLEFCETRYDFNEFCKSLKG